MYKCSKTNFAGESRQRHGSKISYITKKFTATILFLLTCSYVIVRCWPPSWEPQEEGIISTAASLPSV
jgi:hypothetical protein